MNIRLLGKKQRLILCVICALLLLTIIFSCCYVPADSGIVASPGGFSDALKTDGYTVTQVMPEQIPSYSDSEAAMMMDAAAAYPFVQSRGGQFTSYYLSTIVIAVDSAQTDALPSSWDAILHCDENIALASHRFDMISASLIHALGGENAALRFLYTLQKQERLIYQKMDDPAELFEKAPIVVLTDDEAAYLIKQGMQLYVFVPSEGTLTMPWGLYEKASEITLSKDTLVNAGLRLPDGSCDQTLYQWDYSSVQIIQNYEEYGRTADSFFPRFRREVLGVRRYTTANGFEHLLSYLIFAFGICIWAFSIYMRTADRRFQKILMLQALVLLFWMLLRYLKLIVYGNCFFLWYLYYLPKLFSPLLFVYACHISAGDKSRNNRRINAVLAAVTLLLLIFVLTNDLHQGVFRFTDKAVMNWVDDYQYNFGYFIVMGWIAALVSYGFFLRFRRARNAGSAHMILAPVIALAILIAYGVAYVCKVQIASESEFSFIASAFILILWELCIDVGLFQSNRHYADMFGNTKTPVWLLNSELQIKRQSKIADELPTNVTKAIMEGKTRLNVSPTEVCDIMNIHGGYFVWKTDISRILALQTKLREKAREIEEQNLILQKEADLKKEAAILKHRQNAIDRFETIISDKLKEIRGLSQSLSGEQSSENKRKLIRIKLLTGFCKRIGMLMLSDEHEGYVKTEILGLLLQEAAIDVNVANIICNVYYVGEGKLPTKSAVELYIFFSRCMMNMIGQSDTAVFCRLLPGKGSLTLLLIVDTSDDLGANCLNIDGADFSELQIIHSYEDEGFMIKATAGGYIDD